MFLKDNFDLGNSASNDADNSLDNAQITSKHNTAWFWFHIPTVSEASAGQYGRYIYAQLLPVVAANEELEWECRYVMDGDCLPQDQLNIPGSENAPKVMEAIMENNFDNCYVVGFHALSNDPKFSEVDQGLRQKVQGYLGCIPCWGQEFEDFLNAGRSMMLVYAFNINFMRSFEKANFTFLNDNELRSLGFDPKDEIL